MTKLINGIVALGCILCASLGSRPVQAQTKDLVLGVNASMGSLSVEQQNAILAELHAAGIHYIRAGIAPDEKVAFHARNRLIWHQETVSVAVRHHSSGNQIRIGAFTGRVCPDN